jgi:hypothetical protein
MNRHTVVGATAGDDWEIRVTLLDADGQPINLSSTPPILWTMLSSQGKRVIEADEVSVAITDAVAGRCSVFVPAAVTTRLTSGLYTDSLRLVMGGISSTMLSGDWNVMTDPFGLQASGVQFKPATVITLHGRPAARVVTR